MIGVSLTIRVQSVLGLYAEAKMIEKITKLTGIGVLHRPIPTPPLPFKKRTIIYAENGRGKSTFVAMLRSLSTGDTAELKQRETLKGQSPQVAELICSGKSHTLAHFSWTSIQPDIHIFDGTFIDESVYSGGQIVAGQRKNLQDFAIGQQGVKLAQAVDEYAKKIAEVGAAIKAASLSIERHIHGTMPVSRFISLKPLDDAETVLRDRRALRDAIARGQEIENLPSLAPLSLEPIPIGDVRELLAMTTTEVSADATSRVKEHINAVHADEMWIRQGYQFELNENCPFCAQPLKDAPILDAYQAYFSDAYEAYVGRLNSAFQKILLLVDASVPLKFRGVVDTNRARLDQWRLFFEAEQPKIDVPALSLAIANLRGMIEKLRDKKLSNPIQPIEISVEDDSAFQSFNLSVTRVDDYNNCIATLNARIADVKQSVAGGNLSTAQAAVDEAENQITRHTPEVDAECTLLLSAEKTKKSLEQEKETKRQELDEYSSAILTQYKDAINYHLKKCNVTFSISDLRNSYIAGKPRFDYAIEMHGTDVDLSSKPGSKITFATALSQGDKSTLAFAFFLARIEKDKNIDHKIIVFDDPLSSLDGNRRTYTRQQIAKFADSASQLIVLTHDAHSVSSVIRLLKGNECAVYRLKQVGDYSEFEASNVDDIVASSYKLQWKTLIKYSRYGTGQEADVVKAIRPLLEHNLHYRFPGDFSENNSLGDMLGKIRKADALSELAQLKSSLDELATVNSYCVDHTHGDHALSTQENIVGAELKGHCEWALSFIKGLK
jgi:wobble nucleotide-excising tRNase